MTEPKVLFEDLGDIAVIKLNRPEKRNALDQETVLLFNAVSYTHLTLPTIYSV